MTYAETLAYLYAQLPLFQRIGPAAYKADLGNTLALMDRLGHPERGLKCVHVAGTNGKGSTSHMLASMLQEAGLRVGLHTSPHLKDLRERFRIDGRMVDEQVVADFVEQFRSSFEAVHPSFFEWGVAFALWWFRRERVDIAVLETGMGGRLDSTNVVVPEVSVITNVGWDHMQFLGDTLEKIAAEKAGIIKPGVPVIVGEAEGRVLEVLEQKAAEVGAPLHRADQGAPLPYALDLAGPHQQRNALTAFAAIDVLREKGWNIPDEAIARGLANVVRNTGLQGRWQVLSEPPLTIADAAHNVDGLRVVRHMLEHIPFNRLHIVFGTVNDKDVERVLAELPKEATYYFCKADIPRGLPADELQRRAASIGLNGRVHGTVKDALHAARRATALNDLILVTGSVFVVAEVL
ncbi:MAG: bifunctional folylpolyglutamate synthase/dihydrofolate synthase [Flavobacteriales bacterium]|nr:bifunctional folylpolyglutamate synthase/dihydrofolate synthase [Flavobacteriales bacterium]